MALMETLPIESVDTSGFVGIESLAHGQALLALHAFIASDETRQAYKVDAATKQALRRAAAQYLDVARDKVTPYLQRYDGKQWHRVLKDEKVPAGTKTRTAQVKSYKAETLRRAVKALRDEHSIDIATKAEGTKGISIVMLSKLDSDSEDSDS